MNCPACKQVALVMAERHGIEIDYCPQCRGVWLDRGELDKIIERASFPRAESAGHSNPVPRRKPEDDYYDHDDRYGSPKRKRRGFLGDLFDFD